MLSHYQKPLFVTNRFIVNIYIILTCFTQCRLSFAQSSLLVIWKLMFIFSNLLRHKIAKPLTLLSLLLATIEHLGSAQTPTGGKPLTGVKPSSSVKVSWLT